MGPRQSPAWSWLKEIFSLVSMALKTLIGIETRENVMLPFQMLRMVCS
jgi:hypothetical protein